MSQENVEVVTRCWEVFQEGIEQDDPGVLFDRGLYAPVCTVQLLPETYLGTKPYVGRDGPVEWVHTWTEDFDEWSIAPEEVLDAGGDHVVALVRQSAVGKGSGSTVELVVGMVYTLRAGQVIDQRIYLTPPRTPSTRSGLRYRRCRRRTSKMPSGSLMPSTPAILTPSPAW